jgi:Ca2+-binding RTX toxin-like protein
MARLIRELDIDIIDVPDTTPAFRPAAPLAADGAATTGTTAVNSVALNAALDDLHIDLSGGVLAPVTPVPPNLVIHGTTGNDYLVGGAGNDVMRGLAGDDFINGGFGNDSISGDAGHDMVFGGEGNDHINGNDGDDLLRGNNGNDSIWGSNGNDIVEGSEGDDRVEGGAGQDFVSGGAGDDTVRGNDDADTLDGGAGSDRMDGGKGQDTLTGGEGRDFFMASPDDVAWNAHSHQWDIITDFTPGGWPRDCIDLRLIMDQTSFTGTTAQQAYDQGYLSLSQYQRIDEDGTITHGTIIVVDKNGSEPEYHGQGVANVFLLEGVQTHEISFTAFASHFLV